MPESLVLQPKPTDGLVDVTPVARGLFLQMLLEREIKGIETYGTTLRTENGRDAVRDAQEELIDAWQYLTQISLERESLQAENRRLRAAGDEATAALEQLRSERESISHAEFARFIQEAKDMRAQRDALRVAVAALMARSPFFVTINHGVDDILMCQFCTTESGHEADCPWLALGLAYRESTAP